MAGPRTLFILGGTLSTLAEPVGRLTHRGWRVFCHVDMVKGLSADVDGLAFLAEFAGPTGIITTHSYTVQLAKKVGLVAIQRIFLVDSQSIQTGITQAKACQPDAVEVLPGLLPRAIRQMVDRIDRPIIAGGLIINENDARMALAAGATSVSTSERRLWPLNLRE